jgi:hypothetical protein
LMYLLLEAAAAAALSYHPALDSKGYSYAGNMSYHYFPFMVCCRVAVLAYCLLSLSYCSRALRLYSMKS